MISSLLTRRLLTTSTTSIKLSSSKIPNILPTSSTIAVTGASGYLGSYIVSELLSLGYKVNACTKTVQECEHLYNLANADAALTVVSGCDLDIEGSYLPGFDNCDGVIHTAAKVALGNSQSIVDSSVLGTRNILNTIDSVGSIRHYVHTSSCAAIQTYDKPNEHVFSESDWNDWSTLERGDAYGVAKTRAERLVHEHFSGDGEGRRYNCINPNVSIGPVMTKQHSLASTLMLREIIYNNPTLYFQASFVDVRDVAAGHVAALTRLDVNRERFVLTSDYDACDQRELARIASDIFPDYVFDAPSKIHPLIVNNLLVPLSHLPFVGDSIMTEFQRQISNIRRAYKYNNNHAKEKLGMEFRDIRVSVKDGVESMINGGFAKPILK
jgi:nucleoside-diphosphate-sugar epimerase